MPLRGHGHSGLISDEQPYFESLAELDAWCAKPREKLLGVLPYQPRPQTDSQADTRGRLLVCHDYKGGYTEVPSGLCYTFNFWSLCDTFVYFSHHRVTIPPSGWTNAAHKQGARMLGTLIFEHSQSAPECLQLVVGEQKIKIKIPISRRYAVLLAQIAYERGFDGYLLNFEFGLQYGSEQARALAAWILLLREELRSQVGPHAQAVWYDSVTFDGKLRWQDRLNGYNLPFFLASDTFFTNYTWRPEFPALTAQYFLSLDPTLIGPTIPTIPTSTPQVKTLQSIFTGVDVWGRGQYGGGGFGSYRAITRIDPEFLGLSVALFGPAWTWESEEGKPEWNWDKWWDYERQLWLGPADPTKIVPVQPAPEGPFKPMTAFFQDMPPPDPACFAFYTFFSPGVGRSWFVQGKKVLDTVKGWTDVDKQCSIGNLVWPRPNPVWEGEGPSDLPVPVALSSLNMSDGYNGGNTLELTLSCAGTDAEDAFFRCIWLPVQSLTVTTQTSYEARVVCKTSANENVTLDYGIGVRSSPKDDSHDVSVTSSPVTVSDLPHGWTAQTIHFTITSTPSQRTASVAIGIVIGIVTEDPTTTCTFSMSLGQLAVYPSSPPPSTNVSIGKPSIPWAKFTPTPMPTTSSAFEGTLTWDTTSSFVPANIHVDSPEDPNPAWFLQDTPSGRFPRFAYFNIYAAPLGRVAVVPDAGTVSGAGAGAGAGTVAGVQAGAATGTGTGTGAIEPLGGPASAVFVGTTGLDGRANRFYVENSILSHGLEDRDGLRFYVQGVTDRGEVLAWKDCGFVDQWRSGRVGVEGLRA